jgi:hypothetical protein
MCLGRYQLLIIRECPISTPPLIPSYLGINDKAYSVKAFPACLKAQVDPIRFPQGISYTPQVITKYQGFTLSVIVQRYHRQSETIGTHQCELTLTRFEEDTL